MQSVQGRYRQKAVAIEAAHMSRDVLSNRALWPSWLSQAATLVQRHGQDWTIATPEGWRVLQPGDWLVRDESGAIFPLKAALFETRYETAA